ncbi:uncharacterized protein LOC100378356 [Saccoglossus kowalevskii]
MLLKYLNNNSLAMEYFTYSRLLYKLNKAWRHKKSFQYLRKFAHSLKKMQDSDLSDVVEEYLKCIGEKDFSSTKMLLPSKQMTEYMLVRLLGFSQLCAYNMKSSIVTINHLLQELSTGDFISYNLMFVSLVSRIWILLRALLLDIIASYSNLRPWIEKATSSKIVWLKDTEQLPDDLSEWLGPDNNPIQHTCIQDLVKVGASPKSSSCLEKIFSLSDDKDNNAITNQLQQKPVEIDVVSDIGEPLSATEFAIACKQKQHMTSTPIPEPRKIRKGNTNDSVCDKPAFQMSTEQKCSYLGTSNFAKVVRIGKQCETFAEIQISVIPELQKLCQKMQLSPELQSAKDKLFSVWETFRRKSNKEKSLVSKFIKKVLIFMKKIKKHGHMQAEVCTIEDKYPNREGVNAQEALYLNKDSQSVSVNFKKTKRKKGRGKRKIDTHPYIKITTEVKNTEKLEGKKQRMKKKLKQSHGYLSEDSIHVTKKTKKKSKCERDNCLYVNEPSVYAEKLDKKKQRKKKRLENATNLCHKYLPEKGKHVTKKLKRTKKVKQSLTSDSETCETLPHETLKSATNVDIDDLFSRLM